MTLVRMFEWVLLYTDLGKAKYMTCTIGFIWEQLGNNAHKQQVTGKGATFLERKWKRLSCSECVVTMAVPSLRQHMEIIHGRSLVKTWEVETRGGGRDTYRVYFL